MIEITKKFFISTARELYENSFDCDEKHFRTRKNLFFSIKLSVRYQEKKPTSACFLIDSFVGFNSRLELCGFTTEIFFFIKILKAAKNNNLL